ncbi:antirepressor protein [Candidatus Magnetobacterium bavaricum]|uniref:Antirepressor protein n=1 Tax=Candidatus Magnetobacterium bavaricum TaxID=29290 RepID=A0A0F3GU46_9BACT|nr:antirepressor protein [Candidatus Magnetobacterium bavaricum]
MNVQNLPTTTQVKFHDDTLITIQQHGKVYVAIKPVCQTLGLDWKSQYNRIQRDPVLSICMVITTIQIPGDDQSREITFLPLDKFHGWLFKINPGRVKNSHIREKVIRYQRECYDVLYEHLTNYTLLRYSKGACNKFSLEAATAFNRGFVVFIR